MTNQSAQNLPAFAAQLRGFIQRHSSNGLRAFIPENDQEFDSLALSLFKLQFDHNPAYRQFCQPRKISPPSLQNWRDIPALPAAAFKELELTSIPQQERAAVFHSSGTTEHRPSRHFHNTDSLSLYEASLLPWFAANFLPDAATNPKYQTVISLTPSPNHAPNSSLVHMFETIRRAFAAPGSAFTGHLGSDGAWSLNLDQTLCTLRGAIASQQPILLLGTAFNFVHLLDYLEAIGTRIQLPRGSRVLETGGYKGRARALPKTELHGLISRMLGISRDQIICEYGMSELSSQAYEATAGNPPNVPRVFLFPPWARAQITSPETGREAAEGETGLIRVFDLANVYSIMAIQTEDLGIRCGDGFELLGRAALAEPRGCSLAST
jgi:hypothetical protein